jgi:hypothetical protein
VTDGSTNITSGIEEITILKLNRCTSTIKFNNSKLCLLADPVATRSKAWVYESRWGQGRLSLVSTACCQVEVSASGWSLVQSSPTECGVSECDSDSSIMRRPWPTTSCCAMGKSVSVPFHVSVKRWRCLRMPWRHMERGRSWGVTSFLTSALGGREWCASRPGRLTPGTDCIEGWVEPGAGMDFWKKEKITCFYRNETTIDRLFFRGRRYYTNFVVEWAFKSIN